MYISGKVLPYSSQRHTKQLLVHYFFADMYVCISSLETSISSYFVICSQTHYCFFMNFILLAILFRVN